ncbi:unnamed protein product [Protopolystoma xenopodis]|uniref:Uncharacterized protein n=1 Tax=Protopolystoma xenopodis TaxID=117903 RepID=A0A448WYD8_9PLAT|nr:unnamed protein product [Protopolystoma xenopodis]
MDSGFAPPPDTYRRVDCIFHNKLGQSQHTWYARAGDNWACNHMLSSSTGRAERKPIYYEKLVLNDGTPEKWKDS